MKHLKKMTVVTNEPKTAMDTGGILMLIGTIFAGLGSVLMGISPFFGDKSVG